MNSENILWKMLDIFRGSSLRTNESLELVLQILAWAKLSVNEGIPSNLRLSKNSKLTTAKELFNNFHKLGNYDELGENRAAFDNISPNISAVPSTAIVAAIDFALAVAQSKLLSNFDIPEGQYTSPESIGAPFIPGDVINVMAFVAGNLKEKTVYCPYDTLCLIARHVRSLGGEPFVETPWRSSIPWLTNILTDSNIYPIISDPLHQPAFIEGESLQKFDISMAFPPFGTKIDIEVAAKNLFKRFKEQTSSGSILSLRHIIAQTKEKAVIAVQNSILFSRGAEHSLREDLLHHKMIETVVSMPPALLPFTPIPFSILVLDVQGQSSSVRFVNGAAENFSTRDRRNRSKLVNLKLLLETIQNSSDEALVVNVPVEDIIKNDSNLEAAHYLLPPAQKVIRNLFNESTTRKLKELVEFLRPAKPLPKSEIDGVPALEVGIADFPDYGYLPLPSRQVLLSPKVFDSKERNSFLRSQDIVIAIKGSAGKVAIIPVNAPAANSNSWVANQSCLILRSKGGIDPRVLFIYLCSDVGQTLLRSNISEATVPLIQLQQLKEVDIVVPNATEVESIIYTFEEQVQIQAQIESFKEELQRLSKVHWSIPPSSELA